MLCLHAEHNIDPRLTSHGHTRQTTEQAVHSVSSSSSITFRGIAAFTQLVCVVDTPSVFEVSSFSVLHSV